MIDAAMLFIGSIIGAGFATGAEIVAFFGGTGLSAAAVAVLVFASLLLFMAIIVFLQGAGKTSKLSAVFFAVLYFVLFVAMTAGVIEIAGVFAGVVSLVLSVGIVLTGFDKMAKFNTVIVAAIIAVLLSVCVRFVGAGAAAAPQSPNMAGAVVSSLLYGGLNCCVLPEITAAAAGKNSKKKLYAASALAAAVIAVFVFLILNAIRASGTAEAAMPVIALSNNPITFSVVLLAILTSQYSALFAIGEKVKSISPKMSNAAVDCTAAVLAFGCSFLGFGKIVSIGYPIIGGFICLFLISSLCFRFVLLRKPRRQNSCPPVSAPLPVRVPH